MTEKTAVYSSLWAYRGTHVGPASVRLAEDFSRPPGQEYRVTVSIDGVAHQGSGADAFAALGEARASFEPQGWLLGIKGCSPYFRMSGMLRDMGGGKFMYDMSSHDAAGRPTTVSTFSAAPLEELATIESQLAHWRSAQD